MKPTQKRRPKSTPARPTGSGAVPTDRPARGAAERVTGGRRTYTPLGPASQTYTSSGYRSKSQIDDSGAPRAMHLAADAHLRYEVADLRAMAQRFDRDNGIAVAIVDRVLDVIIGPGWKLQSRCTDEAAAREVERLSCEFWHAPEVRGLDDGAAFQRLLGRHLLVDGDGLLIKDPASGRVQFIGADRIDNVAVAKSRSGNRIERGVELDRLGRPVAYWIGDYGDQGQLLQQPRRFAAEDCIFVALRRRFEQTRGTPALQPVFAMLHRINDVCDSEAAAWQLLSRMALTINRKDAAALADEIARAKDPTPDTGQTPRKVIDITDEAVIFNAEPGETIAGVDRNIPGQNFPESLKMFLRLTGLPVGLTLEWLLMIWSDTSYSSARASVKQVERATIEVVGQVRRALCEMQEWRVRKMVAARQLPDLADIAAHEWVRQPLPMIDQQKEDDAAKTRLAAGLSAPSIEAAEGGQDDEEIVGIQAADIARRIEAAHELNEKYPDAGVTWRTFTAFGSESVSLSSSGPGAAASAPDAAASAGEDEPSPTEPPAEKTASTPETEGMS